MQLHFERTVERPLKQLEALLRQGPEAWLPDVRWEDGQPTVEIAVEEAGRRLGRRVRISAGTAQPSGYGVAIPISWQAVSHPNLYPRLQGALRLDRLEGGLASFERVKYFRLLDHDFAEADGELTPTQKTKRRAIQQRYETLIDTMYQGHQ